MVNNVFHANLKKEQFRNLLIIRKERKFLNCYATQLCQRFTRRETQPKYINELLNESTGQRIWDLVTIFGDSVCIPYFYFEPIDLLWLYCDCEHKKEFLKCKQSGGSRIFQTEAIDLGDGAPDNYFAVFPT